MTFPISELTRITTPYYYYDMALLQRTLQEAKQRAAQHGIQIHYALKANANAPLLQTVSAQGFGADCVSGGEIERALKCGFAPEGIAFAGTGKTDAEILFAIQRNIWCFNCESPQEIDVINTIAAAQGAVARIALRINPNVDAHTHSHISTGIEEGKFGIQLYEAGEVLKKIKTMPSVELIGLHFHIGSQILEMGVFAALCRRVNEITAEHNLNLPHINLGGGLGVDYTDPDQNPIPDFKTYFSTIRQHLKVQAGQTIHVELGRSLAAQCGALITKTLYVKNLRTKNIIVADAGMTDLIRPALYGAHHHIQNLTASSAGSPAVYDVVGPVCESADCLGKSRTLPLTQRGDLLAVRTAGAYGEVMASRYNGRQLPAAIYSALPQNIE